MKKSGDVRKRREPPDRGGWGPDAGSGQGIAPEDEPQGEAKNVKKRDEIEPSPAPGDEEILPEDDAR